MTFLAWFLRNTYYRNRMFHLDTTYPVRLLHTYCLSSSRKPIDVIYLGRGMFAESSF